MEHVVYHAVHRFLYTAHDSPQYRKHKAHRGHHTACTTFLVFSNIIIFSTLIPRTQYRDPLPCATITWSASEAHPSVSEKYSYRRETGSTACCKLYGPRDQSPAPDKCLRSCLLLVASSQCCSRVPASVKMPTCPEAVQTASVVVMCDVSPFAAWCMVWTASL